MNLFLTIISCILIFYLVDQLLTLAYCKWQQSKSLICVETFSQEPTFKNHRKECHFLKKQIKSFLHLYRGWIRYKLIRIGHIPCHTYRNFILRHIYLMKIAKTAVLYGGFEIRSPWRIEIGEGSIIGDESKLDGRNGIVIGKNVNFSTGVWIWTEQHDFNDKNFACNHKGGCVLIGDRAWISCRTTILPGVNIAEGCVLAAGATAVKSIESPYTVWGGIPAKYICERNSDLQYEFTGSHESFW